MRGRQSGSQCCTFSQVPFVELNFVCWIIEGMYATCWRVIHKSVHALLFSLSLGLFWDCPLWALVLLTGTIGLIDSSRFAGSCASNSAGFSEWEGQPNLEWSLLWQQMGLREMLVCSRSRILKTFCEHNSLAMLSWSTFILQVHHQKAVTWKGNKSSARGIIKQRDESLTGGWWTAVLL